MVELDTALHGISANPPQPDDISRRYGRGMTLIERCKQSRLLAFLRVPVLAWRVGIRAYAGFLIKPLLMRLLGSAQSGIFRLAPRSAAYELECRAGSSDREVFRQVFVERGYADLDDVDANVIVDCGANVGYSSAYFLTRHPRARVIAVEPDDGNFAVLRRNLAPYGSRASLWKAGIWSSCVPLALVRGTFRDGREWATQVRPVEGDEAADLHGVDLATLIERENVEIIDILKMDIEAAEREVFGGNVSSWLPRVRNLALEIHDEECRRAVLNAIPSNAFEISDSGELTIFRCR